MIDLIKKYFLKSKIIEEFEDFLISMMCAYSEHESYYKDADALIRFFVQNFLDSNEITYRQKTFYRELLNITANKTKSDKEKFMEFTLEVFFIGHEYSSEIQRWASVFLMRKMSSIYDNQQIYPSKRGI